MLNPIASRVEQYMDVLAARQKLTASNIANADTPGYKTKDVDFTSAFAQASSTGGIPAVEVSGLSLKPDGNNVSLDRESRNLAESALRFNIATQFLQNQLRMTKVALQDIR